MVKENTCVFLVYGMIFSVHGMENEDMEKLLLENGNCPV